MAVTKKTKVVKKWKPAPTEVTRCFDEAVSQLSGIERRKMFGYPCAFARGNMFVGLHEAGMVLRLSEYRMKEFAVRDLDGYVLGFGQEWHDV